MKPPDPGRYESGLVSDGDPALAFGPRPGPEGFEAIAVSRTNDVMRAAADDPRAAVWNDVREAEPCPAVNVWRMSLRTGGSVPRPAPNTDCPPTFGNSDIFGASFPDPTP